jgi:hypothetical protein
MRDRHAKGRHTTHCQNHEQARGTEMTRSRRLIALCLSIAALAALVAPLGALLVAPGRASAAPVVATCANLSTDSRFGLKGSAYIKSVTSAITTTAAPASVPYCRVTLVYGTNPNQNITIAVGLPLSPADGGAGGVVGAWNARTEGLGGGVCTGTLNVDAAVNAGYVGSGTDGGHPISPSAAIGDCATWVKPDGTYDIQHIEDFFRNGIKQQILWSKQVARIYYSSEPSFNYWNGCSTGGRQGYLLAQELGDELDGVLADAPAMYWTRFATAQAWGEIAMFDLAHESPAGAIPAAKLETVRQSAIAACDASDGVVDGVIDDPRSCNFSARANVCGVRGAPSANCLTAAEAEAVDRIWDGPRNSKGERIWFGLDRGTDFSGLDGTPVFPFVQIQFEWDEKDQSYAYPLVGPGLFPTSTKWNTVTLDGANNTLSYARVAQDGSRNIADVTDTFRPLDAFRAHGGKMITFVGANDQLIYPRGVINYYRQMASRYGGRDGNDIDFRNVQRFYRLFRAPGVGHCGGGAGPSPVNPFGALVSWVEQGVPPMSLLAVGGAAAPPGGRTRPLCPYPKTAIYNGSGSINDANSFHCGGNLEARRTVCADVLVKYKHELNGNLDFRGTGVSPEECGIHDQDGRRDRDADDDDDLDSDR